MTAHCQRFGDCNLLIRMTYRFGMLVLAAVLAACTIGPRYHTPAVPPVDSYTPTRMTSIPAASGVAGSAAQAQQLVRGAPVPAAWWQGFQSPALDALVTTALAHNPSLDAAQATLEQAQFLVRATRGTLYPQVSLGLGAERTRSSGASSGGSFGPQIYNLYTGEVSISYFPDVFGLNRSIVRGAQAQADVAADELAAARLSIAGNVVNVAMRLAGLDGEVAATRKSAVNQQQVLDLTRKRYQLGAVAQFEVFTQESLLASTQAQLAQLEQARDQALHLLSTLLGAFPATAGRLKIPALGELSLPTKLPVSLPSTLVRNRPDIRAAEAQLRGANAQVAIAVAQMYPHLQLTAAFGGQANFVHALFNPAGEVWDLAADLAAPLFEGGSLRARKHAAEAAYRGVFATYRNTVLGAFRNVADVLRALAHDSALLEAQVHALHASRQALGLVTAEYRTGQVGLVDVLISETQYQTARVSAVKARTQRFADTAALYVALGGSEWMDADVLDVDHPASADSATRVKRRASE